MKIHEVDLLALSQKLKERSPLSGEEKSIIDRIIWNYDKHIVERCDFIMVLGNPTCIELRLPTAIQLWEQHQNAQLILCGGVITQKTGVTEAEGMREACLAAGVTPEKIILENKSTITRENIEFAAPIIHDAGIPHPVIVVISSPTHMRRVQMNFDRFIDLFPVGTKVIYLASFIQGLTKNNWYSDDRAMQETAIELSFIHEYIYELGYAHFEF